MRGGRGISGSIGDQARSMTLSVGDVGDLAPAADDGARRACRSGKTSNGRAPICWSCVSHDTQPFVAIIARNSAVDVFSHVGVDRATGSRRGRGVGVTAARRTESGSGRRGRRRRARCRPAAGEVTTRTMIATRATARSGDRPQAIGRHQSRYRARRHPRYRSPRRAAEWPDVAASVVVCDARMPRHPVLTTPQRDSGHLRKKDHGDDRFRHRLRFCEKRAEDAGLSRKRPLQNNNCRCKSQ